MPALRRAGIGTILVLALFLCPVQPHADTEVPLFSVQRPVCEIDGSSTAEWRSIIFRVRQRDADTASVCVATQNDTTGLIGLAFASLALQKMESAGTYRSIFLGRLIDYEWLSGHLATHAANDPDWSTAAGTTTTGERAEAYVQRALAQRSILDPIDEALKPYGYRARGFSCEKAMVSGPDTKPFQPAWVAADKRLPFDALCHLTIETLP